VPNLQSEPSHVGCDSVEGDAAEFFRDVVGEQAQDTFLWCFRERLNGSHPVVRPPIALFSDEGEDTRLIALSALPENWEFRV